MQNLIEIQRIHTHLKQFELKLTALIALTGLPQKLFTQTVGVSAGGGEVIVHNNALFLTFALFIRLKCIARFLIIFWIFSAPLIVSKKVERRQKKKRRFMHR